MSNVIKDAIAEMVETEGSAAISGTILDEQRAFSIALQLGHGFFMEPYSKRRTELCVGMLFKDSATQVMSTQVAEIRKLRLRVLELERQLRERI